MRRFVVFLVLFATGLALLFFLTHGGSGPGAGDTAPITPPPVEQFTPLGKPKSEDGAGTKQGSELQPGVGVSIRGKTDFVVRTGTGTTLLTLYEFHADNVEPLGGELYDAHGLTLLIHDPASGHVRTRLRSPLTRLEIAMVEGRPTLGAKDEVRLANVELELLEGAPIVPITLRVPLLVWKPSTGSFRSDDRFGLEAKGLQADGTGLAALQPEDRIELEHDGRIEIELDNGLRATLRATGAGPIIVQHRAAAGAADPARADEVELSASDGALLTFSGANPVEIRARELVLHGRASSALARSYSFSWALGRGAVVAKNGDDSYKADEVRFDVFPDGTLEHVLLDRDVVLERKGQHFESQHAEFTFGADSRIASADFTGQPHGSVEVGPYLGDRVQELREAHAIISGPGLLHVELEDKNTFDLVGPGDLVVPEADFALHAQTRLHGRIDPGAQGATVVAEHEVELCYDGSTLASEHVELRYALDADGKPSVSARSVGPTTVILEQVGPEPLVVQAGDGLEVRSIDGHVTLPLATIVQLDRDGPHGFHASAQRVRDVDRRAQSFTAEGAVSFEDERGRATAERIVSRSPTRRSLYGTAAAPAHYELFAEGSSGKSNQAVADAIEIQIDGEKLEATGAVHTTATWRDEPNGSDDHYEISSEYLRLVRDPLERAENANTPAPAPRGLHLYAEHKVHAIQNNDARFVRIDCERLALDGKARVLPGLAIGEAIEQGELRAEGAVHFDYRGVATAHELMQIEGDGELFTLDRSLHGVLAPLPGGVVHAVGKLPGLELPYQMQAEHIEFDPERLDAVSTLVHVVRDSQDAGLAGENAPLELLACEHLHIERKSLVLDGKAHANGRSPSGEDWEIEAGTITLEGQMPRVSGLTRLFAAGGVHARLGTRAEVFGDTLLGEPAHARLEGAPARLVLEGAVCESPWIEYDIEELMLATGPGRAHSQNEHDSRSWSVEYESLQPFDRGDSTIVALRNAVFHKGDRELRMGWALLWLDRDEWRKRGQATFARKLNGPALKLREPEEEAPNQRSENPRTRIAELRQDPLARVLSEVYLQDDVELLEHDPLAPEKTTRRARATTAYLDLKLGIGWMQDADVILDFDIKGHSKRESLRAKAQWMRVSAAGDLRADKAVLTTCLFDEPHFVIETGDLLITPKGDSGKGFDIAAHDNFLRLGGAKFAIPLPALVYASDKKGVPLIGDVFLGSSAKFGTAVLASFNFTLGSLGLGVGSVFSRLFDLPTTQLDGHWRFDVGYLGLRGLLLGANLNLEIDKTFNLDLAYSVIPDNHQDSGLIRVPTEDRSLLRQWFRVRGRRIIDEREWIDVAFSYQTDPAVQSEFFERDYFDYEQKDNFLHWRKATDRDYFSASLKARIEDRTDIEELPSLAWWRARTPVFALFRDPVLYSSHASVAYLRRHDGNVAYYQPLFPDEPGDHEVVRFDTEHRLELPVDLGWAGLRTTPFVSARASVWDRGIDDNATPARAGLFAGVELSTTLWKRYAGGTISTISPTLAVRADVADAQTRNEPVSFDLVEKPYRGNFVDTGVRARWWNDQTNERFDLDLSASHGSDVAAPLEAGWQPLAVLGELLTFVGEVPIGFTHDARYSLEGDGTVYSRTYFGFRPTTKWGIELGFNRAQDQVGRGLYEAASLATRYHATQKWEFEFRQTLSIAENKPLENDFALRRFGHDFVMELDFGYIAGEGARLGVKFVPDLSYRKGGLGLIDRWLGKDD